MKRAVIARALYLLLVFSLVVFSTYVTGKMIEGTLQIGNEISVGLLLGLAIVLTGITAGTILVLRLKRR